jgi:hypothetical protein
MKVPSAKNGSNGARQASASAVRAAPEQLRSVDQSTHRKPAIVLQLERNLASRRWRCNDHPPADGLPHLAVVFREDGSVLQAEAVPSYAAGETLLAAVMGNLTDKTD